MNILILGSGIVGANLAQKLSEQGKNVFLIDDNTEELKSLSDKFDIKTLTDDPLDPGFYKNFNQKINYFIAVTKSDEKNILTCKFAKDFLKVDKTIARIRNQNLINEANDNSFKARNEFLDYVISPENEVAGNIFEKIHMPGAFFSEKLISNQLSLVGLKSSDLFKNNSYEEIKEFFNQNNIIYIGHSIEDKISFDFHGIKDSDHLYLILKLNNIQSLIKFFGFVDQTLNILLIGGGNIGYNLAKLIEKDEQKINLKILENDSQRCDFLVKELKNSEIFNGNALDQSLYEELDISNMNLVISVTDSDQINIILSIIAKKRGSDSVISLINNETFSSFANDLGIDIFINPRELTTSRIIEKISQGNLLSYHSILRDSYIIYEIKYDNDLFEIIKNNKIYNHICTFSEDKLYLNNNDHLPSNSDVLFISMENRYSAKFEKILDDY
ncbi:MAG: NAD-binding protein [Alphaproteobacteria bacterium]|jgi:trk system potassium uptake protein TrkA|tara:strand:+ start:292 stop:1620 length:1329 start_codon:yes stop_codon:yes gene_type:complete